VSKYLAWTRKEGDCLIWTRCLNSDGYPRAGTKDTSNLKVHREVFFDVNGYYPPVVRHTCDNPKCINPSHLIAGNPLDNVEDRIVRGRTFNVVTEEEDELVKELRSLHLSYHEIGKILGIKSKRVEYIITRARKES